MRIGPMRHKVTIEQLTPGSPDHDAGGVPDESWATFASVFAEIKPLRGRELFAAQQVASEVTGTIRIRYLAGVTAKMRVNFSGRYFDILAPVNVDERNREWLLYVKEGVNVG